MPYPANNPAVVFVPTDTKLTLSGFTNADWSQQVKITDIDSGIPLVTFTGSGEGSPPMLQDGQQLYTHVHRGPAVNTYVLFQYKYQNVGDWVNAEQVWLKTTPPTGTDTNNVLYEFTTEDHIDGDKNDTTFKCLLSPAPPSSTE